jgi:hypothetical protein
MTDDKTPEFTRRDLLSGNFIFETIRQTVEQRDQETDDLPPALSNPEASENTPDTRGPATDIQAILDRAENMAAGGDRREETPHPAEQENDDKSNS